MLKVLFVDDDIFVLDAYKRMLRLTNVTGHFLTNSIAVLDYLKNNQIDIVVADFQMPALNGAALLAQIKSHYPSIKRVVVSGNLNMLNKYSADIFDAKLEKPCNKVTILNCINAL